MKALQIRTDGEVIELADIELETLQQAVGGLIQPVDLTSTWTLWCNEEGKVLGLPHNPYAQCLWDECFGHQSDYIVGDIVITGGTGIDGETLGISEREITALRGIVERVNKIVLPHIEVSY